MAEETTQRFETLQLHAGNMSNLESLIVANIFQVRNQIQPPSLVQYPSMPRRPTPSMIQLMAHACLALRSLATSTPAS